MFFFEEITLKNGRSAEQCWRSTFNPDRNHITDFEIGWRDNDQFSTIRAGGKKAGDFFDPSESGIFAPGSIPGRFKRLRSDTAHANGV